MSDGGMMEQLAAAAAEAHEFRAFLNGDLRREIESLKEQLQREQRRADSFLERYHSMNKSRSQYAASCILLEKEIQSLRDNNEQLEKRNEELRAELRKYTQEGARFTMEDIDVLKERHRREMLSMKEEYDEALRVRTTEAMVQCEGRQRISARLEELRYDEITEGNCKAIAAALRMGKEPKELHDLIACIEQMLEERVDEAVSRAGPG